MPVCLSLFIASFVFYIDENEVFFPGYRIRVEFLRDVHRTCIVCVEQMLLLSKGESTLQSHT